MAAAAIVAANAPDKGQVRRSNSLFIPRDDATIEMPPKEEILHSSLLLKRVVNPQASVTWAHRTVVLTKKQISVSKFMSKSNTIIEILTLEDIDFVRVLEMNGTALHPLTHRQSTEDLSSTGRKNSLKQQVQGTFRLKGSSVAKEEPILPNKADEPAFAVEIVTDANSWLGGKRFIFAIPSQGSNARAEERALAEEWQSQIQNAIQVVRQQTVSPFDRLRARAKVAYASTTTQMLIALIIFINFGLSVVAAQLVPEEDSKLFNDLERIELAFTAAELLFNMLGNWFHDFWHDWWNIFDFVVVIISILSFILTGVPGLGILRMTRVFRVLRVFKRLKSLRKVIRAVVKAVVPVVNAFGVLAIVMCIYSVIGVQLFGQDEAAIGLFNNFGNALFTMFQVCTSMEIDVVASMFEESLPVGETIFFVSFMLIVGTVLLNVVIAVLLDEFISSVAQDKAAERLRKEEEDVLGLHSKAVLDPLLLTLVDFNTSKDLSERIRTIYQVLDADESGGLSYQEMKEGMRRLRTTPPVVLSLEDFDTITEGGSLCDANGELDLQSFEVMMRRQMAVFVQRTVATQMSEISDGDPVLATLLFALKQLTLGVEITGAGDLPELHAAEDAAAFKRAASTLGSAGGATSELPPARRGEQRGCCRGGSSQAVEALTAKFALLDSKMDAVLDALHIATASRRDVSDFSREAPKAHRASDRLKSQHSPEFRRRSLQPASAHRPSPVMAPRCKTHGLVGEVEPSDDAASSGDTRPSRDPGLAVQRSLEIEYEPSPHARFSDRPQARRERSPVGRERSPVGRELSPVGRELSPAEPARDRREQAQDPHNGHLEDLHDWSAALISPSWQSVVEVPVPPHDGTPKAGFELGSWVETEQPATARSNRRRKVAVHLHVDDESQTPQGSPPRLTDAMHAEDGSASGRPSRGSARSLEVGVSTPAASVVFLHASESHRRNSGEVVAAHTAPNAVTLSSARC